jgi:hypothetical protein
MREPGTGGAFRAGMEVDPVAEAARLAELVAELLQRAVATAPLGHRQSELRFVEALARTLSDQLATMLPLQSSENRQPPATGGTS